MVCDIDRIYTALNDQLQDAFDDEFRLRSLKETDKRACDEFASAQKRVQALIERITIMLEPRV